MLPFLKKSTDGAASSPVDIEKRKTSEDDQDSFDGLESCMEELHSALMSKKYKDAAEIFRSCFEFVDKDEESHE